MAELRPYPFGALIRRVFRELETCGSICDLPRGKFFLGGGERELSTRCHGRRAATPLGPAAGPQSQMAQNILLSWLGGSRILELKTVQIDDELTIPRPCIDMQTVGYNIEWSQELKLAQSLEEYVKGSMLIEILVASGELELQPGAEATLFDMSVGYDLAGIRSEPVQAFLRGMQDATAIVERLRSEIPDEYRRYRDLDFTTRLSDTLTLSTFHGCPPDEIEAIVDFLLRENGLNCIVKLNPTLLGPDEARELLHGDLGYEDLRIPDSAFEDDTRWEEMEGFCQRLGETAGGLGLGFGVKFTNTLIVHNHRDFFPETEKQMYLSGAPLHVLAMRLVGRFRERFGDTYPVSFSAGVDRRNFPDAAALGLAAITVCSDLLKPGGYARLAGYFDELEGRMEASGAGDLEELVIRAYGNGASALEELALDEEERERCVVALERGTPLKRASSPETFDAWVSRARLLNTRSYVEKVTRDPRYAQARNARPPRKIGSHLELFDCITCDKCIPVCPNDANFTFVLPRLRLPVVKLRNEAGLWSAREDGELVIEESHQIANFADFCNDCGNCDVFCPEDGGPYLVKPRFFGRLEDWRGFAHLDGFHLSEGRDGSVVHGRFGGVEYVLSSGPSRTGFAGPGFELELEEDDPAADPRGSASTEVDLTYFRLLIWIRDAVGTSEKVNYVSAWS